MTFVQLMKNTVSCNLLKQIKLMHKKVSYKKKKHEIRMSN